MEIKKLQNISSGHGYYNSIQHSVTTPFAPRISIKNPLQDTFTVTTKPQQVSFTGLSFDDIILKYLKARSFHTSINASKRPYVSISKDLKDITNRTHIQVSPTEAIEAWDINPKNSKKYVLYLHGFSQNITNNQPLYKELTKTNYGLLAIDYRGYGRNPETTNYREKNIVEDVNASIKYLKNKGVKEIGLIGHSFGGYIAAKVSNKENIKFQILIAPMTSLETWLKHVLQYPKKYKSEHMLIKCIPRFKDQYKKVFEIKKYIENNLTPTHIIQAHRDRYVRTARVNDLSRIVPNLETYTVLSKGGHRMDEDKINSIIFILQNL